MKYLGYANEWEGTPAIVTEAWDNGVEIKAIYEGCCVTRYECPKLGFYYRVDSGD